MDAEKLAWGIWMIVAVAGFVVAASVELAIWGSIAVAMVQ